MKKKILIVDDVPGWTRFHRRNLEYIGMNLDIEIANSAKEALAKIETSIDEPYTTIFTDLQMEGDFLPKLAGEWFIEQVKMFPQYADAKIVIISASANIKNIAKRLEVDFFPKSSARTADSKAYEAFL